MSDATPPSNREIPDASDAEIMGLRLHSLRKARRLSIAELAEQSGLSAGIISQIERGKSNPSIMTLQRLRSALGVNLWELLSPDEAQAPNPDVSNLVRHEDTRMKIVVGKTKVIKELLSPQKDASLRVMMISLPPGSETEDVLMTPGQKAGYVLENKVCLTVGAQTMTLETGASFQFDATRPHKLSNPFDAPARVIWIMSLMDAHL